MQMFVWDEVKGGRGSDEIASALMKWLALREAEEEEFDVLRIFCDNCAGQNKNIFVLLAALRLIHAKKLFRIELVFMVSGHSFLPCDRAFGVIEKKLRVTPDLYTTNHYMRAIKQAKQPAYEVLPLERKDIFDIKALAKYVTKRPTPVSFANACQLVVSASYKEGYKIKTDHLFDDTDSNVHNCRLMKTSRRYSAKLFDLSVVPLTMKYPTERLLNPAKVKDLATLSNFVGGPVSKQWLQDLVARQRDLQAESEDLQVEDSDDDGSDEENDLHDYEYLDPQ